jgi:Domain of unknown function (DUF4338)
MKNSHSRSKLATELKAMLQRDLRAARRASGSKDKQRALLLRRKAEILRGQQAWIDENKKLLPEYQRRDLPSHYVPESLRFVVCTEQWQHDLWRIVKLSEWSMPPNEYIGRRKRILVFDEGYLMGIIGVASCIWGLKARDEWIGWSVEQKTKRIGYVVDTYVMGAIPPYNGEYRGSKLLAFAIASDEFRKLWQSAYGYSPALVVNTTLFGHSAVMNRLKYNGDKIWKQLGYTRGLGTMHFRAETFQTARNLLELHCIEVPDRLSEAPNWKLRLMRTAIELVGLRAEDYLQHGYKRGIYAHECATNAREFLKGEDDRLKLTHIRLKDLIVAWKNVAF